MTRLVTFGCNNRARGRALLMMRPSSIISPPSQLIGLMIVHQAYSPRQRSISASSCCSFSTTSTVSSSEIPFYGLPRSASSSSTSSSSSLYRLGLMLENALTAIRDPTRADAVAAVGELTGQFALQRLYETMKNDPHGRVILQERPIVSKATIPYQRLISEAQSIDIEAYNKQSEDSGITFGQAYGHYLSQHDFDPDERDEIKHIEDPDLAYVMLRYRQCHDFWHTLTNLPPTVAGELGLKWLELFQTGLPLAALSCTIGSLSLKNSNHEQQHLLWNVYLPWARRVGQKLPFGALMMVHYEQEWDTPLVQLQRRLGIEPAPQHV